MCVLRRQIVIIIIYFHTFKTSKFIRTVYKTCHFEVKTTCLIQSSRIALYCAEREELKSRHGSYEGVQNLHALVSGGGNIIFM